MQQRSRKINLAQLWFDPDNYAVTLAQHEWLGELKANVLISNGRVSGLSLAEVP